MSTAIAATPKPRLDQNATVNGVGFEQFLYNWFLFIRQEQSYQLDLTQAAVTLHIRARGVTVSDMVSNWGVQPQTQGLWVNYDPNLDGDVHPINVVGPAMTTNKNACLQSNSQTQVTSANASARHKQIAQRWQRVCEYAERKLWDEAVRTFLFDDVQKGGTDLIEIIRKPADTISVPEASEGKRGLAVFECVECNKGGVTQVDVEEEGMTNIECPECGITVPALVKAIDGLNMSSKDVQQFEIDSKTIPSFNFTVDTYGAKVGGLQSAEWIQVQWLRNKNWMNTHYPGRSFSGPSRWSYPLQADYALSRGRWQWLNYMPTQQAMTSDHERYDVKEIYLHEDSYSAYRAPADYQFVNSAGVETFSIKKGESIGEAQKRLYGENQHGFKFEWTEDTLLGIPTPEKEELNFRHRFSDCHWSRESGGYLSSPNYSLVYIQDDITMLNTMHTNIAARNAVNPVYYDSLYFDQADFSKEYIGTSKAALMPDGDMRSKVTSLPVPTPSPYLMQQMQFLWGIKDTVSMVTPAMRGESANNEPYAAQRQQLEQSFGNLTSVLKSFAQCKMQTFLNFAGQARKIWSLEQFQRVGSMWGEIWTEEDVQEMCDIDFEQDLVLSYREGSEMPSSPMTKEFKFFGALQQLLGIVSINPGILGTDKLTKILQKIDEFGEFDFDLTGLENDELIAQKRYNDLATVCMPFQDMPFEQLEMMRMQVVAMEPPSEEAVQQSIQLAQAGQIQEAQQIAQGTPITELDITVERIFHEAKIRFSQFENLEQQDTFFVDMVQSEIAKTKPNYMLIEVLSMTIEMIRQAIAQFSAPPPVDPAIQAEIDSKNAKTEIEAGKLQLEGKKLEVETELATAELGLKEKELEAKIDGETAEFVVGMSQEEANREERAEDRQFNQEQAKQEKKKEKSK